MRSALDLLAREMSETFRDMHSRLHDLSESEYFWEPVPGSWTVFRDQRGRWEHHFAEPDPEPAPFTTIGWQLTHVAMCKVMYHEHAFGPREPTWLTIETPGTPVEAIAMLDAGHARLTDDLADLDEPSLDAAMLTN